MPTYEYACKACGEHLEVVQSFKDDPLKECPNCGGELRKVFAPIGIAFKGSGFYKTDSRPSPKEKSSSSSSSSSSSGESKSGDSKSDSKSDAKSDKKSSDSSSSSSKSSEAKTAAS
jgi:putative FmdB family regulatory protein